MILDFFRFWEERHFCPPLPPLPKRQGGSCPPCPHGSGVPELCLLTYKTLQIQQPTYLYNIVFLSLLTLCLQDHLIHRFCPSHMSEHLWVKGPFLSLLQDSGTPSHLTPVTRYLFLHSAQNPSFQVSLPLLNSLPSYHRTAYPDLILVFPLLPIEWYLVLDTGH